MFRNGEQERHMQSAKFFSNLSLLLYPNWGAFQPIPYRVEPAGGPARFFWGELQGVCRMEGRRLILHVQEDQRSRVPWNFTNSPGAGTVLFILEREQR
jgi:hypothetical protein